MNLRIILLGSITLTFKNLKIFKIEVGIVPEIMKFFFPIIKNPYDLRNETKFNSRNDHTV